MELRKGPVLGGQRERL